MARFGINPHNTYGISIPTLRRIAKQSGKDHRLALDLWKSGIHEARILAALVDVPEQVTAAQMERWVKDFDSWDVCDQVCSNLFDKTPFAYRQATGVEPAGGRVRQARRICVDGGAGVAR